MRYLKRICLTVMALIFLMSSTVFANDLCWENVDGHHNQSVLLEESTLTSKDSIYRYARGDYLAEGSVQIANLQNGSIGIDIDTLAYRNVDSIFHTVFLDIWDAEESDWINLGYWDFEQIKEEVENQELYMLLTSFTLTGYETNRYYRVRGLHGVEYNDEIEACATESDGVLITDGPT